MKILDQKMTRTEKTAHVGIFSKCHLLLTAIKADQGLKVTFVMLLQAMFWRQMTRIKQRECWENIRSLQSAGDVANETLDVRTIHCPIEAFLITFWTLWVFSHILFVYTCMVLKPCAGLRVHFQHLWTRNSAIYHSWHHYLVGLLSLKAVWSLAWPAYY